MAELGQSCQSKTDFCAVILRKLPQIKQTEHAVLQVEAIEGVPRSSKYLVLGGSWVVISGVISRVSLVITHIKGPIAHL